MEERRKGRCQMCGELVEDEGWFGHSVPVMRDGGLPEPAPCGPIDWDERRKGERRVKPVETCGTLVRDHGAKPWGSRWIADRRRAERRKGE